MTDKISDKDKIDWKKLALNKYKQKLISKEEAFKQLITLKELTGIDAKNILKNIDNNNVTPMKLND